MTGLIVQASLRRACWNTSKIATFGRTSTLMLAGLSCPALAAAVLFVGRAACAGVVSPSWSLRSLAHVLTAPCRLPDTHAVSAALSIVPLSFNAYDAIVQVLRMRWLD
jgi:hypothetical protein